MSMVRLPLTRSVKRVLLEHPRAGPWEGCLRRISDDPKQTAMQSFHVKSLVASLIPFKREAGTQKVRCTFVSIIYP